MNLDPKNRAEVYYDRILKQLDDISNGTSDSESGSEGLNPVNRAEMYYKMILDKIDEIADGGSGGDIDPAVIEQAVSDWLTAHPEATTTVADGSITYNKLDANLKGKADAVSSLSDEIEEFATTEAEISNNIITSWTFGITGLNGNVSDSTSYKYTNQIICAEGDIIAVDNGYGNGTLAPSAARVTVYENGVAKSEKGATNATLPFIAPAGCTSVVLTVNKGYLYDGAFVVVSRKEKQPIGEYHLNNGDNNMSLYLDSLSAGKLSANAYEIPHSYDVPTNKKAMYICTDINKARNLANATDSQKQASLIPFLYFNGHKVGTFVMFDSNNNPYVLAPDGTTISLNGGN